MALDFTKLHIREAYHLGRSAYDSDLPKSANPYNLQTNVYKAWSRGWADRAYTKMIEEQKARNNGN